ncbi:YqzE family protein [Paenibacillus sp. 1P07SE]|uniref:YqzE family protein n=1 Tax=Paenibacillus sp. 1P07SE TaxID=3132209 RepID=UPI0039A640CE
MADSKELITYVTKQVVRYVETPRAERKQQRKASRVQKEHWTIRWFGLAPLGFMVWWKTRWHKVRSSGDSQ